MAGFITRLYEGGVITPPQWMPNSVVLEVIMGSRAYGCNSADSSDYDVRGVFVPPKTMCFPAVAGLVVGYDQIPACDNWVEPHVKDPDGKKEFDFDVHNICKFVRLAEQNNPNQVDLLFAHETLVKHCSAVGRMLLDARHLFLSKLCWKRFRGYASDQWHHVKNKKAQGKRKELVEKFGYDVKFASHAFRLLRECEQILSEGNLDLFQGNEELKAIRRGDFTLDELDRQFAVRKEGVERLYHACTLPEMPDHEKVRALLLACLEHHYGSLAKVAPQPDAAIKSLREVDDVLRKVRHVF